MSSQSSKNAGAHYSQYQRSYLFVFLGQQLSQRLTLQTREQKNIFYFLDNVLKNIKTKNISVADPLAPSHFLLGRNELHLFPQDKKPNALPLHLVLSPENQAPHVI